MYLLQLDKLVFLVDERLPVTVDEDEDDDMDGSDEGSDYDNNDEEVRGINSNAQHTVDGHHSLLGVS